MHWIVWRRQGLTLFASMMLVAGCQTSLTPTSGTETRMIDVRVVCRMFPQRDYSRHDTEPTRRHIVGDNAAKRELCGET